MKDLQLNKQLMGLSKTVIKKGLISEEDYNKIMNFVDKNIDFLIGKEKMVPT